MNSVSRETIERLRIFEAEVRKWSPAINLVARGDLGDLKSRHFADSLQLATFLGGGPLVDLGSGGGFPGLVIAAVKPLTPVTLIEADARKAAFLRAAARLMDLTAVTVFGQRIEAVPPQGSQYVSARALAPLARLLGYVQRHLRPEGTALLMKGAQWQSEVDDARHMWDFRVEAIPSQTNPNAAVLNVTNLRRR